MRFYTVGHSNHALEDFVRLLLGQGVTAVADVRSQPYSRYASHFNREALAPELERLGIAYVYLGHLLGGRPSDSRFYDAAGHVLYDRLAESRAFLEGIERLEAGAEEYTIAIMCGEENPAHCHRNLLVSRVLVERGHTVCHIRGDGSLEEAAVAGAEEETGAHQLNLFGEESAQWRFTRSVSPGGPRRSSSSR